jgi:hypothetical protein
MNTKTGDLYEDTKHLDIKVEEKNVQGATVYVAVDKEGNQSSNCESREDADLELRAWHDAAN